MDSGLGLPRRDVACSLRFKLKIGGWSLLVDAPARALSTSTNVHASCHWWVVHLNMVGYFQTTQERVSLLLWLDLMATADRAREHPQARMAGMEALSAATGKHGCQL